MPQTLVALGMAPVSRSGGLSGNSCSEAAPAVLLVVWRPPPKLPAPDPWHLGELLPVPWAEARLLRLLVLLLACEVDSLGEPEAVKGAGQGSRDGRQLAERGRK